MYEQMGLEYRNSRLRMQEIAASLSEDEANAVVMACPDWNVRDLFSHVTGIAADLGSGKGPTGDTQAWVDELVSSRKDRSLASVVDEWNEVGPTFEAAIDNLPKRLWTLTYDTVVHEHDLRAAVERPGDRESEGVKISAVLGLKLVKVDLASKSLPAFRAIIDGVEHIVGDGEPVLTLTASAFDTLRLLGSRRTLAEMKSANFVGNLEMMLPGITHMELPVTSLGE
jgi:uncharacterized protein (TIGR03083 family)